MKSILVTRYVGVGLGLLSVVAGGLALAQTFDPLDLSGKELFDRYCAACHGPDALGNGPVANSLNKRVPDLTVLARNAGGEFPATLVRETIDGRGAVMAHGTRQMPVWGYEFWVEEGADIVAEGAANEIIDRLVAHLESLQVEAEQPRIR
jgi:mono/diheme cytochrome c family protein